MKETLYNQSIHVCCSSPRRTENKEKTSALNRALKPVSTQYSLMVKQKSALCIYLLHKNSCYWNTSICELLESMSVECESLQTVDKLIHEQNKCLNYIHPHLSTKEKHKNIFENNEYSIQIMLGTEMENKIMNDRVPCKYLVPQ